jgi:hypothetical protein
MRAWVLPLFSNAPTCARLRHRDSRKFANRISHGSKAPSETNQHALYSRGFASTRALTYLEG